MTTTQVGRVRVEALGRLDHPSAMARMREVVQARLAEEIGDTLLTVEHEPVYTAGRHADTAAHVLGTRPDIPIVPVDRGGDVTYHGPGQAVLYPVVRLAQRAGVRAYVEALLSAAVRTAGRHGIAARVQTERAGVWVGEAKLAAVGIRVDRGVTSHGMAFNVHPDLSHFSGIVPCGLAGAAVCSLASLGVAATLGDIFSELVADIAAEIQPLTCQD